MSGASLTLKFPARFLLHANPAHSRRQQLVDMTLSDSRPVGWLLGYWLSQTGLPKSRWGRLGRAPSPKSGETRAVDPAGVFQPGKALEARAVEQLELHPLIGQFVVVKPSRNLMLAGWPLTVAVADQA